MNILEEFNPNTFAEKASEFLLFYIKTSYGTLSFPLLPIINDVLQIDSLINITKYHE